MPIPQPLVLRISGRYQAPEKKAGPQERTRKMSHIPLLFDCSLEDGTFLQKEVVTASQIL
jgi:hypothetical protein